MQGARAEPSKYQVMNAITDSVEISQVMWKSSKLRKSFTKKRPNLIVTDMPV